MAKFKELGTVAKLIVAIVLGLIVGQLTFLPIWVLQLPVTISAIYSTVLGFIVPLMIFSFVLSGIANMQENAGKILAITLILSFISLILSGLLAYGLAGLVFPNFIEAGANPINTDGGQSLESLINLGIQPLFNVPTAILLAIVMGMAMAALNRYGAAPTLTNFFKEFNLVINTVLKSFIIPLLPIYIFGNFVALSYSGQALQIISTFAVVIAFIVAVHFIVLTIQFLTASQVTGRSFMEMVKNQIPAYLTAFGSQSSSATVPENLKTAQKNGISKEVAEFVIPIGSSVHMAGSTVSIVSFVTGLLMMQGLDHSVGVMIPFIFTLALTLVAAPGVPGGAVMAALPILGMVGIPPEGQIASILITIYMTQDSFGTSTNVSVDNPLAALVDHVYQKINKTDAKKYKTL